MIDWPVSLLTGRRPSSGHHVRKVPFWTQETATT